MIETMKSHAFSFGGFPRNYWDFHLGYGLFLTAMLLIQGLLFWYLAGLVRINRQAVRPVLALFVVNYLAMAIVAWRYFSLGPLLIELLIAACLATAFATAHK